MLEAEAAVGGLYKGVKLTHCWQMSKMLFPPLFGPIWFYESLEEGHILTVAQRGIQLVFHFAKHVALWDSAESIDIRNWILIIFNEF